MRGKAARPRSSENTRKLMEDYVKWPLVVNTAESMLEALDLETRYQISCWDALIVQAADRAAQKSCIRRIWQRGKSTVKFAS